MCAPRLNERPYLSSCIPLVVLFYCKIERNKLAKWLVIFLSEIMNFLLLSLYNEIDEIKLYLLFFSNYFVKKISSLVLTLFHSSWFNAETAVTVFFCVWSQMKVVSLVSAIFKNKNLSLSPNFNFSNLGNVFLHRSHLHIARFHKKKL